MSYFLLRHGTVTYTGIGQPRNVATRRYVVLVDPNLPRQPLVVVTESREDQGVSITNAIENVREKLARDLRTFAFRLIEHYDRTIGGQETFDWVYFTDDGRPIWKPLATGDRSREAFVRLLNGDSDLAAVAVPEPA